MCSKIFYHIIKSHQLWGKGYPSVPLCLQFLEHMHSVPANVCWYMQELTYMWEQMAVFFYCHGTYDPQLGFPCNGTGQWYKGSDSGISCPSSNGKEDLWEHGRAQPSVSLTTRCIPALPGLPYFTGTSDLQDVVSVNRNEFLATNLSE